MLVDLDAFFASVEQLDHPGWRGKPVIVGGYADKRGVVSTASYEARKFGVHSAMPSSTAARLCPNAIWTAGNYHRYREVSNQVMEILRAETPHVQQVSIDEAFLDVTPTRINTEHPISIALRIQKGVEELGVTCSIGIGTSKSIAKIASDMDKPQGLTVVAPGSEANFLDPLPTSALSGIGPAAQRKLHDMGIDTLGQLAQADDQMIVRLLGKPGEVMLSRARGIEDSNVEESDEVKSVSNETSFSRDLTEKADVQAALSTVAAKVGRRLRRKGLKAKTITVKVRFSNLSFKTAQRQLDAPTDNEFIIRENAFELLFDIWQEGVPLRLVGISTSGFQGDSAQEQLSLFDPPKDPSDENTSIRNLLETSDRVKDRFGEDALKFGRDLRMHGTSTGSSSKNPADYK